MIKSAAGALLQVVIIIAVGAGLALAGNAIRWDKNSVDLSREYFKVAASKQAGQPATNKVGADLSANRAPAGESTIESTNGHVSLDSKVDAPTNDGQVDTPPTGGADEEDTPTTSWHGFQMVTYEQAREIFDNSFYETGVYMFVDARDDSHYQQAHVRGAVQVDHYRVDDYLPNLLDLLLSADQIVVYCNGGQCEDSIFVCTDLIDAGIPFDRVFLFEGGIKEWQDNGAPTVSGSEPWGAQ